MSTIETATANAATISATPVKVSVVIPTYKRRDAVAACVRSLLAQTHLPDEILFVDDSPGDHIKDLHEDLQDVKTPVDIRFIDNPGRASLTRSRNHGIANTDGDVVLFFDSDCIVDKDYIALGLAVLAQHPDAMAVRGIEADRSPYPVPYRLYRWFFAQPITGRRQVKIGFPPTFTRYGTELRKVRRSASMKGSNMMIRRAALEVVQFDEQMERYSLFEDLAFALALRKAFPESIYCHPQMRVDHGIHEEGRIPDDDLWMMHFVNKHYLSYKFYRVGPLRRLKLWWSDVGYVVMRSERDVPLMRELWGRYKRVQALLRKHHDQLVEGDISGLNRYYSWMDGPDHGL